MILRKHKNILLAIIQESGLDPKLFSAKDETINKENFFIIRLLNSPLQFEIRNYMQSFDYFETVGSEFADSFPLGQGHICIGIEDLSNSFTKWLSSAVKPYLDEVSTPDLWQTLEDMSSDATREIEAPDDFEPFTKEEKIQLRRSIDELRLLIVNNFALNRKETDAIKNRLQYLSDAADKHNKFDWKGIAIHTAITIAITLALNPEQTHQLFQLFKQVFSNIIHLLP